MERTVRLETRNADMGYDGNAVVNSVDISVCSGEILVLIGPNGAGKSTVLRSIAGQLELIHGMVYLSGKDMKMISPADTARQLSFMGTERPGGELLSCREVASAGRYPYTGRLGLLSDADRETVEQCLHRMGASQLADLPFQSISDGQKQRVLLARALCQEPEVLILDEPATYLDIRYQLELVDALKALAGDGLSIVVSLHALDLVRRCGGKTICLKDGKVDRYEETAALFRGDYLETLFSLPAGSLDYLTADSRLSHYIHAEGKTLRCGFTTGTCAALAASGAASRLLAGIWPDQVSVMTPAGIRVAVPLTDCKDGDGYAACAVRKDAGDDVDCTDGIRIAAEVRFSGSPGIQIEGGSGVGRVTRPGLDQPVGAAAINSTPRQMIREAVEAVCRQAEYSGGLLVVISVPEGKEAAKKTMNAVLGIEGGISILGTSGIVEPMSRQAMVDTICLELRQRFEEGHRRLILTPGNYGMDFLRKKKLLDLGIPAVRCSNFIGDALDETASLGYEQVLLAGHIGKLVKLAGGIMNTHSRQADCRMELITAHAALCGAEKALCRKLMGSATTDACIALLRRNALADAVMQSLCDAIGSHLAKRAEGVRIGALLFSNEFGLLGMTETGKELIDTWNAEFSTL